MLLLHCSRYVDYITRFYVVTFFTFIVGLVTFTLLLLIPVDYVVVVVDLRCCSFVVVVARFVSPTLSIVTRYYIVVGDRCYFTLSLHSHIVTLFTVILLFTHCCCYRCCYLVVIVVTCCYILLRYVTTLLFTLNLHSPLRSLRYRYLLRFVGELLPALL